MEIIAKTDDGFLIKGSESEVKEVLRAVNGTVPEEIKMGQKIPAIDYAATITKLKKLPEEFSYQQLIEYAGKFNKMVEKLKDVVNNSTDI